MNNKKYKDNINLYIKPTINQSYFILKLIYRINFILSIVPPIYTINASIPDQNHFAYPSLYKPFITVPLIHLEYISFFSTTISTIYSSSLIYESHLPYLYYLLKYSPFICYISIPIILIICSITESIPTSLIVSISILSYELSSLLYFF